MLWAPGALAQADDRPESAPPAEPQTFAERDRQRALTPTPETAPAFYVIQNRASLRDAPGGRVLSRLPLRSGLRVMETRDDGWARVRLLHVGTEGWLRENEISNLWVRIDKSERTVYVYRGAELWRTMPADVSANPEGDKIRRAARTETDEQKSPEGTFYVTRRNAESEYYLAFVLSYPTPVHALRGLADGLISQGQYEAIVSAHRTFREPPQFTRLGGLIEIHGSGSGRRRAWTRGCIALRNVHMDDLWSVMHVGTPVVIEP